MQRVILEVKLLAVAVRRAQASSARQREMQEMEARIGARLASQMRTHENTVAEAAALKRQLSALRSQLAAVQERVGVLAGIERTLEDMKQYSRQFEQTLGADLMALGQAIKAQSAAIESAREGLSRTDFLVERVVETLESLQNAVLDSGKPDEEISLVN
jgi:chromosome segregation ATPase